MPSLKVHEKEVGFPNALRFAVKLTTNGMQPDVSEAVNSPKFTDWACEALGKAAKLSSIAIVTTRRGHKGVILGKDPPLMGIKF